MSIKYRTLVQRPEESSKDRPLQRRSSEPRMAYNMEDILVLPENKRASLPLEYSKLHGFLQHLSTRRSRRRINRVLEQRENYLIEDVNKRSNAEVCQAGSINSQVNSTQHETDEVDGNIEGFNKKPVRKTGSYKYRKFRVRRHYQSTDDLFGIARNTQHVLVN